MSFKTKYKWKNELDALSKFSQEGMTMVAMAEHYGVSRQLIKQVFKRHNIPHLGLKKKAVDAAKIHYLKWGVKEKTELYEAQRLKFSGKKSNSKAKGIEFTIHFGELEWNSHCPVLGMEIDYFADGRQENSPSFDRVDPTKGYIKGNVQIISWRANRIKNDGSAEEHQRIADYLAALKYIL